MALVRRGVLTQEQADKAMREHSGGTALAAEAAEIAAMRRLDI
jgi:hypothetical protein